jgi:hypothetical protein
VHPLYTPITSDSITSEDIYSYDGLSIIPTHITNPDTVYKYGLQTFLYDQPVTIIMPNGTLHYSTSYTLLNSWSGHAVILPYPHTLITWTALCAQDVSVECNSQRLKLNTSEGIPILRIPSDTPIDTPISIADFISTHLPITQGNMTSSLSWTAPPEATPPAEDVTAESDSCKSDDDSVDDIPEIEMVTEYAMKLPEHATTHVRMAWCNINGCDDIQKIERLMALMRVNKLDFLCLLDARIVSNSWGNALRNAATQRLGSGSTIEIFTTTYEGRTDTARVGGQILIKSPRIACPIRTFCDPSGCAAVAGMDFRIGDTDIRII